jgi:hypothetical protein
MQRVNLLGTALHPQTWAVVNECTRRTCHARAGRAVSPWEFSMPWEEDAETDAEAGGGGGAGDAARAVLSAAAPSAEEALAWLEGVCPGASRQARPPQLTRLELRSFLDPVIDAKGREAQLTLDLRPLPGLQALRLRWPRTRRGGGAWLHVRLATAAPPGALHAALRELSVTSVGRHGRMVVDAALLEHLAAEVRARAGGFASRMCRRRTGRGLLSTPARQIRSNLGFRLRSGPHQNPQ